MTAIGLVAIENIKVGDIVVSADPDTIEVHNKPVVDVFTREVDRLVHLTINGEEIVTTFDHPFYVQGRGFVKATDLWIGAELVNKDGCTIAVDNIFKEYFKDQVAKVYNFKVDDYHTYFVGNNMVWVHNANCTPAEKYLDRTEENGARIYKRTLSDGKEYEVKYTKGENGEFHARFEKYATHPDYPDPVYPSDKGIVLTGNEQKDLALMKSNYGKPNGYTWHHLEDGKGMLLVETKVHSGFHHSGGASVLRGN